MGKSKLNFFWTIVLTLLVIYGLIKWLIPFISRQATGMPFPLPVPGTLVLFYMVLTLVALFLYVTFSDEGMNEFLRPILRLLKGEFGSLQRSVVLAVVPLVVGWQVYDFTVPKVNPPVALRIQHPSSNFPKKFESMKNPMENPTDAEIDAFVEQAKAGEVDFIPQVSADIESWLEMRPDPDGHPLSFIPTGPWKKFIKEVESGKVDRETARGALHEKNLFEGRALYAMNCRPCHGDSVAGDGPMADGFKLRPINFTDNGTIEVIVEGYTFWRVANGGPGLPTEATPWDSAMPEWKVNLTDDERWKIIMGEYDLAEKTARIPESHGEGEEH
ncbi:MAG: c-type cytochrome [Deltaproteobacteria bacterium]|nr:c-type cytochrome [Deltaproteobacteria bacterium]